MKKKLEGERNLVIPVTFIEELPAEIKYTPSSLSEKYYFKYYDFDLESERGLNSKIFNEIINKAKFGIGTIPLRSSEPALFSAGVQYRDFEISKLRENIFNRFKTDFESIPNSKIQDNYRALWSQSAYLGLFSGAAGAGYYLNSPEEFNISSWKSLWNPIAKASLVPIISIANTLFSQYKSSSTWKEFFESAIPSFINTVVTAPQNFMMALLITSHEIMNPILMLCFQLFQDFLGILGYEFVGNLVSYYENVKRLFTDLICDKINNISLFDFANIVIKAILIAAFSATTGFISVSLPAVYFELHYPEVTLLLAEIFLTGSLYAVMRKKQKDNFIINNMDLLEITHTYNLSTLLHDLVILKFSSGKGYSEAWKYHYKNIFILFYNRKNEINFFPFYKTYGPILHL